MTTTAPKRKRAKKPAKATLPSDTPAPIELDWTSIATSANAHRFEDLALDLFAEHYDEEQFTPNARRPGKDGGVDGLFSGRIGRVAGPWKIACAVRPTMAAAKRKVKEENALAREAKQTGLFFITSYDGTAVEVAELERLAKHRLRGAKVWCRAQLERSLRDRPWLRQIYFGHQVVPGFVPADLPTELDDQHQPDIELIGRESESEDLRAHITGTPRIVVLVAAGGAGKTRLLRALPSILRGARPARSAWLRRSAQGSIDHALRSGLPARRPLLLILDDAAQALAEVDELTRLATSSDGLDVKVVFAIRSVDRGVIERRLGGVRDAVRWLDLSELAEDDGARIARLECPRLSEQNAKKLASVFGSNLFLLRAAAQLVQKGESPARVVDDQVLRGIVAQRLLAEARSHLQSVVEPSAVTMRLAEIAVNAPIPFDGASEDLVVASLREANLLRRVGNTLRFRRDVEGDVLLAFLLEHPAERAMIQRHVFAGFHGGDLPRQIRNLGAAGRGHAAVLVREVVARWRADPELEQSLHRVLPLLPHCVEAAPDEVEALCTHAAAIAELDTDATGPVLLALRVVDLSRALKLAGTLAELGVRQGTYSNYQVDGIARTLLNPLFHRPNALAGACTVLAGWLDAPSLGARVPPLAAAVAALLAPVVRWDESDGVSMSIREVPLAPTPAVINLRRAALALLTTMLAHPDRDVRSSAVTVLAQHGGPGLGRASTKSLDAAASEEFESLADVLQARLDTETDIPILAALYVALATHWAAVRPGAKTAARLLSGRRMDPLVKAYHYASARTEWFYDFDAVLADAPVEEAGRWVWWVQNFMHRRSDVSERARVVGDLCLHYPEVEDILRCVGVLASADYPSSILDEWCSRNPEAFGHALAASTAASDRVVLERVLRRRRYQSDSAALLEELREMPSPPEISVVRSMLEDQGRPTTDSVVALARHFARMADVALRQLALDLVWHRDDIPPAEVLAILEDVLRDGDWAAHWNDISMTLDPTARADLLVERPLLRARLEDRLVSGGRSGDEWYEQRVLEVLFATDNRGRLDFLRRVLALDSVSGAYRVGRLATPFVSGIDRFRLLTAEFVHFVRTNGADGERAIADILRTAVVDTKLPDGAFELAREMVEGSDDDARRVAVLLLGEMEDSPKACALLADLSTDPDQRVAELAVLQLDQLDLPRRGWSRAIGEPADELVALRETLTSAMTLAQKAGRAQLAKVLRSVEERIASERREDEEVLAPS